MIGCLTETTTCVVAVLIILLYVFLGRAELAAPQQVETNSEAEASSEADKAEELPTEERMASEAQEIVVSSEATVEPR